jgi:hypothetical protein
MTTEESVHLGRIGLEEAQKTILHLVGSDFADLPNQFLNEADFHRTIPNVRGQGKHAE